MDRFVLIDETIVSHGFWVKVSGIDLVQFKKNPIMYWMHQRSSRWDGKNQVLPIGRWEDIKVESVNGIQSVTAVPVFDEKDSFALKIKSKVEGDFVRMASAGLEPIVWSENSEDLKAGQTRATVMKSKMIEASIVDIGANDNAVRLYDSSGLLELSAYNDIPIIINKTDLQMKQVAIKLGLAGAASEKEILSAIEKLQKKEADVTLALTTMNKNRKLSLLSSPVVTDENREHFSKLADADFELAEKTVALLANKTKSKDKTQGERISDFIENSTHGGSAKKEWKDYSEKELEELRSKKTADYISLFKSEYGIEPKID